MRTKKDEQLLLVGLSRSIHHSAQIIASSESSYSEEFKIIYSRLCSSIQRRISLVLKSYEN